MATTPNNVPIQTPQFRKEDLEHPDLPLFNLFMTQIATRLNYLSGLQGPIKLNSALDLNNNPIKNAGVPSDPNDVVNLEYAIKNYSAAAIMPQIEATGKQMLQTTRRLNDQNQQELYSSFLNGVLNTTPTSNTASISATPVGGGSTTITVSAGLHQRLDGSQVPFASRSDTVSVPSAFAYTSATRTNGTVVVVTPGPSGVTLGEAIALGGATDPTFNGSGFVVNKIDSPTQFEYLQNGANASTSGGGYTPVNVYYYTISRGQNKLGLVVASGPDSWTNRVAASRDGSTIIAVAIVSTSGLDPLNSAAGATTPQAGAAVPTVRRM